MDKEIHCRQCGSFLDSEELENGNCPNCETDEDLFPVTEDEDVN